MLSTVRFSNNHFSPRQTEILKGVGIIIIVLHNFFHLLPPVFGENEFYFQVDTFWQYVQSFAAEPVNLLRLGLSYFGHYAVHIFVFFSAYGLMRKHRQAPIKYFEFASVRVRKIYFTFLLCLLIFILIKLARHAISGEFPTLLWLNLLWRALLVSNFIPGQALLPSGPWWFMSFIVQFYLIFPFLLRGYQRYGKNLLVMVAIISVGIEILVNPYLMRNDLNINHLVVGHLPVICFGIYLGARDSIEIRSRVVLFAGLVFVFANVNEYIWMLSDLAFSVLMVAAAGAIFKAGRAPNLATNVLLFYGSISFHLFLINGMLRTPFLNIAESNDRCWIDNLAGLACLLFATLAAVIFKAIDVRIRATF